MFRKCAKFEKVLNKENYNKMSNKVDTFRKRHIFFQFSIYYKNLNTFSIELSSHRNKRKGTQNFN